MTGLEILGVRELVGWHERKADQAAERTARTLHLWAADQARDFIREHLRDGRQA